MIEVSDLKGKDASGTSDPTVYATCLGHTKRTRVKTGVNSAVIDEVLYFNLRSLSRDQLMQATVQLRVLDANTFLRNSLIGSYQFDLLGIYVEKVCLAIDFRDTCIQRGGMDHPHNHPPPVPGRGGGIRRSSESGGDLVGSID